MTNKLTELRNKIRAEVWEVDTSTVSRPRAFFTRILRLSYTVIHDVVEGQLTLRAMSLVYTTLLSLVPLLAVSFSVLKALGVHNKIEPVLLSFLSPLGEKGFEIGTRIVEFVDNVNAGVLGGVGMLILFYTVVSLVHKIERSYNYTWRIKRSRSLTEGFSDYLSVILIGPVLIFSALGMLTSLMASSTVQQIIAIEPLVTLKEVGSKVVPYLLIAAAFTFTYTFIPNTKVRIVPALLGALVASALWVAAGWVFALVVVTSAKQEAIYSGFATLIFFMMWLYVAWLILLVGASVAFYQQHPEYLGLRTREIRLSSRLKERTALLAMYMIADHYRAGRHAWTKDALAKHLNVPMEPLESILIALERADILVRTGNRPPAFLPARDLESVPVKEILSIIRTAGENDHLNTQRLPSAPPVDGLVERMDRALDDTVGEQTLRELAKPSGDALSITGPADPNTRIALKEVKQEGA